MTKIAEPSISLLIENLQELKFELFLTWALILAITYGILKKTDVLGSDDSVIAVTSITVAFLGVFGIYSFLPVSFFSRFFGLLAIIFVLLLGTLIVLSLAGIDISGGWEGTTRNIIILAIVGIIITIGYMGFAGGQISLGQEALTNLVSMIIVLIFMGGAVWFIIGGD